MKQDGGTGGRLTRRAVLTGLAAGALVTMGPRFPAAAADPRAGIGPRVGDRLPHPLNRPDQTGTMRDFQSLSGKSGLILMFSRSFDWCMYCKAEALNWSARMDDVSALGFGLAGLTYDDPPALLTFVDRFDLRFPLLSDPGSEVIRAFGILNEDHVPGSFAFGIPHPMIFVIDAAGIIRHRFSENSYNDRPDIELVLEAARSMVKV